MPMELNWIDYNNSYVKAPVPIPFVLSPVEVQRLNKSGFMVHQERIKRRQLLERIRLEVSYLP